MCVCERERERVENRRNLDKRLKVCRDWLREKTTEDNFDSR